MIAKADPGWIGMQVEDYRIESVLGGGTYSVVYGGEHFSGRDSKVFKVARPPALITLPDPGDIMPTQALSLYSGGVARVKPDTYALLAVQGRKLRAVKDPALVVVEEIVEQQAMCYLRMELIEGQPLSHIMRDRPLSLATLLELARGLDRLSKMPAWETHGDLKPDNVIVTATGVKILDPGHFGKLPGETGEIDCVVTTPAYYPLLQPDDLWAFGILLWHAAVRRHPLYTPIDEPLEFHVSEPETDAKDLGDEEAISSFAPEVGEKLFRLVRSRQNVGQYYLDPLLRLKRPRAIRPDIPEAVESVVLKGMRLQVLRSGQLELADGYKDFSEFAKALEQLVGQGIDTI